MFMRTLIPYYSASCMIPTIFFSAEDEMIHKNCKASGSHAIPVIDTLLSLSATPMKRRLGESPNGNIS
jgi:hypothetical protein